jgi:hypothetical protein
MRNISPTILALASLALVPPAFAGSSTVTVQNDKGTGVITREGDKAAGSLAVDRSFTRASDGATATSSYDRQKTDNGYVASGQATNFRGQTRSWDKTVERDEGSRTVTSSATGRQGNSISQNRTATKGEDGWTSSGTWSTSTGKSGTTSGYARKTDEGYERGHAVQNNTGETIASRDVSVQRHNGTRTKSITATGPKRKHKKPR